MSVPCHRCGLPAKHGYSWGKRADGSLITAWFCEPCWQSKQDIDGRISALRDSTLESVRRLRTERDDLQSKVSAFRDGLSLDARKMRAALDALEFYRDNFPDSTGAYALEKLEAMR